MIHRFLKRSARETGFGRAVHKAYLIGRSYRRAAARRPLQAIRYILSDPECTNFTYEIANYEELVSFLARHLKKDTTDVRRFSDELRADEELSARLSARLVTRRDRKPLPLYGRRVGWYCAVRLLKPKLVVETGVADGLGSAAILRALERNQQEGADGQLISIDIDPASGWLVDDGLRRNWRLVIQNSHIALPQVLAGRKLDFFIHDSDHDYEHEAGEYRIIDPFLAPGAVVFSDNAHVVPALEQFSRSRGRHFHFFREHSVGHFYPGAGIGLSTPE